MLTTGLVLVLTLTLVSLEMLGRAFECTLLAGRAGTGGGGADEQLSLPVAGWLAVL